MTDPSGAPVTAPTAPASPDATTPETTPVLVASGLTPAGLDALQRLETWASYVLDARQSGDAARREIAGAV